MLSDITSVHQAGILQASLSSMKSLRHILTQKEIFFKEVTT